MTLLLDRFKKTKDLMLIINDFKLINFFILLSKNLYVLSHWTQFTRCTLQSIIEIWIRCNKSIWNDFDDIFLLQELQNDVWIHQNNIATFSDVFDDNWLKCCLLKFVKSGQKIVTIKSDIFLFNNFVYYKFMMMFINLKHVYI